MKKVGKIWEHMTPNELAQWLPDAEAERMLALENTFATPGWKYIVEWAAQAGESAQIRAANATSWDSNRIAYGQGLVYNEVMRLSDQANADFADIAEQAMLDKELEDAEEHE